MIPVIQITPYDVGIDPYDICDPFKFSYDPYDPFKGSYDPCDPYGPMI